MPVADTPNDESSRTEAAHARRIGGPLKLNRRRNFTDEPALVEALRDGDEAAFEQLVRENAGRLLAVARRFFSEDADAHDAVQEAFLAAHRSIARFAGGAQLSTWLHRIVVNACLMKLRSRRRKPERGLSERLVSELVSSDESASHQLERHERDTHVRRAIASLPERHRRVIVLRDLEGMTTSDAARALAVSAATVKTRLHRARRALRENLQAGGDPISADLRRSA